MFFMSMSLVQPLTMALSKFENNFNSKIVKNLIIQKYESQNPIFLKTNDVAQSFIEAHPGAQRLRNIKFEKSSSMN